jgi:hypothetical protein
MSEDAASNKNQWFLVAVLFALLVAALGYCVTIWRATPSMPLYRNIIVGVAAVLAVMAGCGLTALMYYSQRKGYDEPTRSDRTPREQARFDDALIPQFPAWSKTPLFCRHQDRRPQSKTNRLRGSGRTQRKAVMSRAPA